MNAKADPVLTLWQRHRQAWTLVHSLAANAPLSSDAFDVADKIDLEIAKTTAKWRFEPGAAVVTVGRGDGLARRPHGNNWPFHSGGAEIPRPR